ncbi:hypothetical protein [Faecalibacter macacae]|uniref:Uncharacterized protein n=1 Tax=Faecalibacter macacae TaxID=1859289 RepID=A0A3L9MBC3_9FLAO|nr:hypothetical protein [Faecalibacter macacae]RLZ08564.1 hypothetical protein EAH69_09625 [Faecalibacter macacae]
MKDLNKAKELLHELAEKANQAIMAIENDKPISEICDLAVEELDVLIVQISSTILGDSSPIIYPNIDVEM